MSTEMTAEQRKLFNFSTTIPMQQNPEGVKRLLEWAASLLKVNEVRTRNGFLIPAINARLLKRKFSHLNPALRTVHFRKPYSATKTPNGFSYSRATTN